MKLSELEERARLEREERQRQADQEQLEKQMAQAEAAEAFRQEAIAWMVQDQEGGDVEELQATLIVENHNIGALRLRVPEHTDITFRLITEGEGYAVHNGSFEVERYDDYAKYVHSLGDALLVAAEEWAEWVQCEAAEEQKWVEREAAEARREAEALERGTKYLDLLKDYPILVPILDLLKMVLEEREQFAADLYHAEEFYAGVEARYQGSLEQAQYEAQRADEERDRLQRDLWDAQDELRKNPRPGYSRYWYGP